MRRLLPLTLLLGACARAGDSAAGARTADSVPPADARSAQTVAFRVGAVRGPLLVYRLPGLEPTPGVGGAAIAGARRAVAAEMSGRRLLYFDTAGALTSFDLVALRERPVMRRGARAALAADGTVLAVDSTGAITESQPWGTRPWPGSLGSGVREVFAAPGARLLALREGRTDSLVFASREGGIVAAGAVPRGAAVAASREADAVAIATDTAVVVYEDREFPEAWRIPLDRPRHLVFSPSGHRLYVALAEGDDLVVLDRFARSERGVMRLPGPAAALRLDPWGRVLLVRSAADSTIWVVSLAEERVVGRLQAGWAEDLPAVTQDAVLLVREGDAIVARDLRSLDSLAAVAGGAADVWFVGRWAPPSVAVVTRQRADTAAGRGRAAALPKRLAPTGAATGSVSYWVQVASSRNVEAARALADELRAQRQPASVEDPRKEGDPWRVLTGPWASRNAADSAGRSLGRPFFVFERGRDALTRP